MNRLWHDAAWCHIVKWQGRLWPRAQAFRCVFSESVLQRTFAYQPKRQWQTLSMSICQLSTEKITLIECTGCRAVHIFLPSPAKQVGNFEFQTNDKTEKHWTLPSVTSLFWIGVPRIYSKNIFKFIWRSLFYNNSHTNITFYAIFAFPQWWKNGCWSLTAPAGLSSIIKIMTFANRITHLRGVKSRKKRWYRRISAQALEKSCLNQVCFCKKERIFHFCVVFLVCSKLSNQWERIRFPYWQFATCWKQDINVGSWLVYIVFV